MKTPEDYQKAADTIAEAAERKNRNDYTTQSLILMTLALTLRGIAEIRESQDAARKTPAATERQEPHDQE